MQSVALNSEVFTVDPAKPEFFVSTDFSVPWQNTWGNPWPWAGMPLLIVDEVDISPEDLEKFKKTVTSLTNFKQFNCDGANTGRFKEDKSADYTQLEIRYSTSSVRTALMLADFESFTKEQVEEIEKWNEEQRKAAIDWGWAEHGAAQDDEIERLPEPAHVKALRPVARCTTCGAENPEENEFCSNGFHYTQK